MAAPRRLVAPVAAAACLALLGGCGGGSGGDEGADRGAPLPVTSPTGTVCNGRKPAQPPARRTYAAPPRRTIDPAASYTATIETSCGDILVALDARAAPVTVNNFVFLARERFYDGLTFHRVVAGFVIQGGDPQGTGRGGPGYVFDDELPDDGYPPGSVAMANAGPDTNGSQFFIVTGDASALPNDYTRFGRVTRGFDVARRIESFAGPAADPADPSTQAPTETIYIDRITIAQA
ncbi:MAG TPA: peptidylprolyl isomerase [Miltoncostaeaceae bacterium]|nr:peptidylprolyl isomerase [Miltoncostaeaceae bacterium]